MFYLISPAVFVAVLSQTEWSTWPPQHTTSWHQRNKAQTETRYVFRCIFSSLCPDLHPRAWPDVITTVSCSFCLSPSFPPTVSHHLSHPHPPVAPLSSPVSLISVCLSLSLVLSLRPSQTLFPVGFSRVTCLILFTGHMALPQPAREKKTVDSGSFL